MHGFCYGKILIRQGCQWMKCCQLFGVANDMHALVGKITCYFQSPTISYWYTVYWVASIYY